MSKKSKKITDIFRKFAIQPSQLEHGYFACMVVVVEQAFCCCLLNVRLSL